jgi:hypothetical protein
LKYLPKLTDNSSKQSKSPCSSKIEENNTKPIKQKKNLLEEELLSFKNFTIELEKRVNLSVAFIPFIKIIKLLIITNIYLEKKH